MSQSESTKDKLFRAAVKIFSEKGFWKTKISDIVKEAGVAQGTFYLYFKSKNHCFREILLSLHNETINNLRNLLEKNSGAIEVLEYFLTKVYNHRALAKVFLFEAVSSGNEFQELYFTFQDNIKDILLKCYLETSCSSYKKEIIITILSGLIRELIEYDILRKQNKLENILGKIRAILPIVNGEIK